MELNDLSRSEQAIFALRSLYRRYGFSAYKMSRFEEYDLYLRNKDFLQSQEIITFADRNGRLLAMKPDVTLSIIKNASGDGVQKLYYNENVYRVDKGTHAYQEIMQSGVECVGDLKARDIAEVAVLAVKSLALLGDSFVLDISHMGIIQALLEETDLPEPDRQAALRCMQQKNAHELALVLEKGGCAAAAAEKLCDALNCCGSAHQVLPALKKLLQCDALEELALICGALADAGFADRVRIDLSVGSDMKYYSGLVFRGYIEGIADNILSGGQYDKLLRKMGKQGSAIGFALNVQLLEQPQSAGTDMLSIALPKGRLGEKVYGILKEAGFDCPALEEGGRKLIFENPEKGVRYFWVKPSDVSIYVERGAADLGIVGKDILLEYKPDVYELLDLGLGKCRMAVAGKKDFQDSPGATLRVATKFPNIAVAYYSSKCRDIDIIHLNGSIELAPILGLSDVIVDIVETGTTLKENDLVVKETIVPISARLIANTSAWQFKKDAIAALVAKLKEKLS